MAASYHICPSKYSLQKLKKDLLSRDLIPSRMSLKEDLEIHFQLLEGNGIQTLEDLITALKNKNKIEEFSSLSGISKKYLTLLRREANSYLPNPVPLDRFSGFEVSDIEKLAAAGIKNSRHIFELVKKNQIQIPFQPNSAFHRKPLPSFWDCQIWQEPMESVLYLPGSFLMQGSIPSES